MELAAKTIGRYSLVEEIGRGGVATVFRAVSQEDGSEAAVKVHFPLLVSDAQMASRFGREVRVLRALQHPNIVPILDFGEENGFAYIVMPYIKDGTLQDRLKTGPLRPREGSRLMAQVTSALDYAHKQGVIHRDVKPSNILLDGEGNALLSDFGFAHVSDASVSLTGSALIGTPAYMSPEQCRGEAVDARSDLYSLGVILFQITTGHLPYEADTPIGVVIKQVSEPLPSPREVCPNLPECVEDVLLRSLEKDPAERYGSAAEMNKAFQTALKEAFSGKPPSTWRRKRNRETRKPSRSMAGVPRQRSRRSAVAFGVLLGIVTHVIAGYGLGALTNVVEAQAGERSPTLVANALPDLGATVSALATANAPVSGTETFPGQVATAVAATLAAISGPTDTMSPTPAASSTLDPPTATPSTSPGGQEPSADTPPPPVEPTSVQGSMPEPIPTSSPSVPPSATLAPPSATPAPTHTATYSTPSSPTRTPSPSKSPTRTPYPSKTPTPTATPSGTKTQKSTATPTKPPTATLVKSPTSTPTPYYSPTPVPPPLNTKTQMPTATLVKSPTSTPTPYSSPSATAWSSPTPVPSTTAYPTYGATPTDAGGTSSGNATWVPALPSPTQPLP